MPVLVNWDDRDHNVLFYSLVHPWTWDEFYEGVDKGIAMTAEVSHMYYIIVDYRGSQSLPPNTIAQFSRISRLPTEQIELVVIAGGGTLFLSLFNLFLLIAGNGAPKYCWVSDLDTAYAKVAERQAAVMHK